MTVENFQKFKEEELKMAVKNIKQPIPGDADADPPVAPIAAVYLQLHVKGYVNYLGAIQFIMGSCHHYLGRAYERAHVSGIQIRAHFSKSAHSYCAPSRF